MGKKQDRTFKDSGWTVSVACDAIRAAHGEAINLASQARFAARMIRTGKLGEEGLFQLADELVAAADSFRSAAGLDD